MLYLLILLLVCIFLFSSMTDLQMLQQNGYNNKHKYWLYLKRTTKNRGLFISLYLLIFLLLILNINNIIFKIIILFLMGYLLLITINNYYEHKEKLPLKYTKRLMRILSFDYLIFIISLVLSFINPRCFSISFLCLVLNPLILIAIIWVLQPLEKAIYNHYLKRAKAKLNKMPALKVIGITGSFGKTSTKMILDSILKVKYKGFITPASFNTPNGIIMTINNEETIFNDYFICEMGARKEGEIKELADIVNPSYGIITSIGKAHLESFKTLDNICNTKFELVEHLPQDGVAILNKDDEYQTKYHIKNKCHQIWIGIENEADVMAKNIRITNEGTTFDIHFKKSKKKITVSTVLLGSKNIYNILSSCALAEHLGLTEQEIKQGINQIKPIAHRLELRKMGKVTILDDSYNSNPSGSKMALETLNLMPSLKVIITPGMVEMGPEQEKLNYEFGKEIAQVCDEVYLIGKKQTQPISEGLKEMHYDSNKINVYNSFKQAYNEVMQKYQNQEVVILIENDLPDSYREG